MSSNKASKKCLLSYVLLFVIVFLIAAFTVIHHSLKQHLSELCRYKCGEILNNILTDAASDAALSGRSYYNITKDNEGRIISVEADTAAVNELQSFLRKRVNERISSDEYDTVKLALGDLTDITYFSGKGPDIRIKYQRSGTADTRLKTAFSSAGINQTRLKVSVIVSVKFTAFLPTGDESLEISQEFIAADTVIVGEVPELISGDRLL